jgi:hypothetical protein
VIYSHTRSRDERQGRKIWAGGTVIENPGERRTIIYQCGPWYYPELYCPRDLFYTENGHSFKLEVGTWSTGVTCHQTTSFSDPRSFTVVFQISQDVTFTLFRRRIRDNNYGLPAERTVSLHAQHLSCITNFDSGSAAALHESIYCPFFRCTSRVTAAHDVLPDFRCGRRPSVHCRAPPSSCC